jgi:hypothetical protein
MRGQLRRRMEVLAAVAVCASIVGVGYADSGSDSDSGWTGYAPLASEAEPSLPEPDLTAEWTYVAGPDGEVLICDGKQMKVKTSTLTGPPTLTPEEAVEMMSGPDYEGLADRVARCGENGELKWVDADSPEAQQAP